MEPQCSSCYSDGVDLLCEYVDVAIEDGISVLFDELCRFSAWTVSPVLSLTVPSRKPDVCVLGCVCGRVALHLRDCEEPITLSLTDCTIVSLSVSLVQPGPAVHLLATSSASELILVQYGVTASVLHVSHVHRVLFPPPPTMTTASVLQDAAAALPWTAFRVAASIAPSATPRGRSANDAASETPRGRSGANDAASAASGADAPSSAPPPLVVFLASPKGDPSSMCVVLCEVALDVDVSTIPSRRAGAALQRGPRPWTSALKAAAAFLNQAVSPAVRSGDHREGMGLLRPLCPWVAVPCQCGAASRPAGPCDGRCVSLLGGWVAAPRQSASAQIERSAWSPLLSAVALEGREVRICALWRPTFRAAAAEDAAALQKCGTARETVNASENVGGTIVMCPARVFAFCLTATGTRPRFGSNSNGFPSVYVRGAFTDPCCIESIALVHPAAIAAGLRAAARPPGQHEVLQSVFDLRSEANVGEVATTILLLEHTDPVRLSGARRMPSQTATGMVHATGPSFCARTASLLEDPSASVAVRWSPWKSFRVALPADAVAPTTRSVFGVPSLQLDQHGYADSFVLRVLPNTESEVHTAAVEFELPFSSMSVVEEGGTSPMQDVVHCDECNESENMCTADGVSLIEAMARLAIAVHGAVLPPGVDCCCSEGDVSFASSEEPVVLEDERPGHLISHHLRSISEPASLLADAVALWSRALNRCTYSTVPLLMPISRLLEKCEMRDCSYVTALLAYCRAPRASLRTSNPDACCQFLQVSTMLLLFLRCYWLLHWQNLSAAPVVSAVSELSVVPQLLCPTVAALFPVLSRIPTAHDAFPAAFSGEILLPSHNTLEIVNLVACSYSCPVAASGTTLNRLPVVVPPWSARSHFCEAPSTELFASDADSLAATTAFSLVPSVDTFSRSLKRFSICNSADTAATAARMYASRVSTVVRHIDCHYGIFAARRIDARIHKDRFATSSTATFAGATPSSISSILFEKLDTDGTGACNVAASCVCVHGTRARSKQPGMDILGANHGIGTHWWMSLRACPLMYPIFQSSVQALTQALYSSGSGKEVVSGPLNHGFPSDCMSVLSVLKARNRGGNKGTCLAEYSACLSLLSSQCLRPLLHSQCCITRPGVSNSIADAVVNAFHSLEFTPYESLCGIGLWWQAESTALSCVRSSPLSPNRHCRLGDEYLAFTSRIDWPALLQVLVCFISRLLCGAQFRIGNLSTPSAAQSTEDTVANAASSDVNVADVPAPSECAMLLQQQVDLWKASFFSPGIHDLQSCGDECCDECFFYSILWDLAGRSPHSLIVFAQLCLYATFYVASLALLPITSTTDPFLVAPSSASSSSSKGTPPLPASRRMNYSPARRVKVMLRVLREEHHNRIAGSIASTDSLLAAPAAQLSIFSFLASMSGLMHAAARGVSLCMPPLLLRSRPTQQAIVACFSERVLQSILACRSGVLISSQKRVETAAANSLDTIYHAWPRLWVVQVLRCLQVHVLNVVRNRDVFVRDRPTGAKSESASAAHNEDFATSCGYRLVLPIIGSVDGPISAGDGTIADAQNSLHVLQRGQLVLSALALLSELLHVSHVSSLQGLFSPPPAHLQDYKYAGVGVLGNLASHHRASWLLCVVDVANALLDAVVRCASWSVDSMIESLYFSALRGACIAVSRFALCDVASMLACTGDESVEGNFSDAECTIIGNIGKNWSAFHLQSLFCALTGVAASENATFEDLGSQFDSFVVLSQYLPQGLDCRHFSCGNVREIGHPCLAVVERCLESMSASSLPDQGSLVLSHVLVEDLVLSLMECRDATSGVLASVAAVVELVSHLPPVVISLLASAASMIAPPLRNGFFVDNVEAEPPCRAVVDCEWCHTMHLWPSCVAERNVCTVALLPRSEADTSCKPTSIIASEAALVPVAMNATAFGFRKALSSFAAPLISAVNRVSASMSHHLSVGDHHVSRHVVVSSLLDHLSCGSSSKHSVAAQKSSLVLCSAGCASDATLITIGSIMSRIVLSNLVLLPARSKGSLASPWQELCHTLYPRRGLGAAISLFPNDVVSSRADWSMHGSMSCDHAALLSVLLLQFRYCSELATMGGGVASEDRKLKLFRLGASAIRCFAFSSNRHFVPSRHSVCVAHESIGAFRTPGPEAGVPSALQAPRKGPVSRASPLCVVCGFNIMLGVLPRIVLRLFGVDDDKDDFSFDCETLLADGQPSNSLAALSHLVQITWGTTLGFLASMVNRTRCFHIGTADMHRILSTCPRACADPVRMLAGLGSLNPEATPIPPVSIVCAEVVHRFVCTLIRSEPDGSLPTIGGVACKVDGCLQRLIRILSACESKLRIPGQGSLSEFSALFASLRRGLSSVVFSGPVCS